MIAMMSPFRVVDAMMDEMDEAFIRPSTAALFGAIPGNRLSCAQPRVETADDKYIVSIAAPGVKAADLTIEAHDDPRRLVVKGRTVTDAHTHFVDYTVGLAPDADSESATADCADGMITVSLPKKAPPAPTRLVLTTNNVEDAAPDAGYKLTVVAPGVAAEDLELSVDHEGVLLVKGSTARTGCGVMRRYALPRDADCEKAHCTHVDGILTVTVPKKAATEPWRIALGAPAPTPSAASPEGGAPATAADGDGEAMAV